MKKRTIYVVSSEAGFVKVGIASNAYNRKMMLQTSSPYKLVLEYVGESSGNKIRQLEKLVHMALCDFRATGEWFSVSTNDAIATIKCCAEESGVELLPPEPLIVESTADQIRCFRIPQDMVDRLDARAEFEGSSRSEVMRDMIEWSLDHIDGPMP